MATDISNSDDIIDSRDVLARIEELESELSDLTGAVEEATGEVEETLRELNEAEGDDIDQARENHEQALERAAEANEALADWDGEEELKTLKDLADQCEGCGDWGARRTPHSRLLLSGVCRATRRRHRRDRSQRPLAGQLYRLGEGGPRTPV